MSGANKILHIISSIEVDGIKPFGFLSRERRGIWLDRDDFKLESNCPYSKSF